MLEKFINFYVKLAEIPDYFIYLKITLSFKIFCKLTPFCQEDNHCRLGKFLDSLILSECPTYLGRFKSALERKFHN